MNLGNGGVFGFTWFDRGLVAAGAPGRETRPTTSGLDGPKVHVLLLLVLPGFTQERVGGHSFPGLFMPTESFTMAISA